MRLRWSGWGLPCVSLLLLCGNLGCRTCDLVEAELRYQTNRVNELENQVTLKDSEIHTLQTTIDGLRREIDERGSAAPPETVYKNVGLAKISLGTMTGGRDLDKDGRADALQVAIEPHDYDGDVLKCPGTAKIDLFQLQPSGVKKNIGMWEADSEQLRQNWRATVLGQGYQLILPWQYQPTKDKLRVVVRFTTVDGRTFEAERDIQLTGPAGSLPTARPMSPASEPPASSTPQEQAVPPTPEPTPPEPPAPLNEPTPEGSASSGEPRSSWLGQPVPQDSAHSPHGESSGSRPRDLASGNRTLVREMDRPATAKPIPHATGIQTRWQSQRNVAYVSPATSRLPRAEQAGGAHLASTHRPTPASSRTPDSNALPDEEMILLPMPGSFTPLSASPIGTVPPAATEHEKGNAVTLGPVARRSLEENSPVHEIASLNGNGSVYEALEPAVRPVSHVVSAGKTDKVAASVDTSPEKKRKRKPLHTSGPASSASFFVPAHFEPSNESNEPARRKARLPFFLERAE
ncbi:MAG: hypothetical protein U1D30_06200 [Planctomycetota bacterium]